ncbi:hypothetical protein T439DRAFT_326477 [Meredithblackwellia eburnea MCA 4105]
MAMIEHLIVKPQWQFHQQPKPPVKGIPIRIGDSPSIRRALGLDTPSCETSGAAEVNVETTGCAQTTQSNSHPTTPSQRNLKLSALSSQVPEATQLEDVRPPIWAMERQALCSSFPYFQSYQSGHYHTNGKTKGLLLDGHSAPGDACLARGKVLITHVGGGAAPSENGDFVLGKDQDIHSIQGSSLIATMNASEPIVVLAGSNYSFFPWLRSRARYCVLGYYYVTHIWEEPEFNESSLRGFFVRLKCRLEWAPSQGKPWFHSVVGGGWECDNSSPSEILERNPCQCRRRKIHVGSNLCYESQCLSFFRTPDGSLVNPRTLRLCSALLSPTISWKDDQPLPPLTPSSPGQEGYLSTRKGFFCTTCGLLSSRRRLLSLTCPGCKTTTAFSHTVQLPPTPTDWYFEDHSGNPWARLGNSYIIKRYKLHQCAYVHIIRPIGKDTRAQKRVDRLYEKYQEAKCLNLFCRGIASQGQVPGGLLTSYYGFNSGKEYRYRGESTSYAFEDSPSCVWTACQLVQRIANRALTARIQSVLFNECLNVAYCGGGQMNYHCDSEKGLGPVVASLSLGAPAVMSFRRKPLKKVIRDALRLKLGKVWSNESCLKLELRHGDVVVMEGTAMQYDFEHSVKVPSGLRFAATCRTIAK